MEWKQGPPVLVGEKIVWSGNGRTKPKNGVVKWIGNIPDLGSDWCVGIELEVALPSLGGDGYWKERKLFECREKHGLLVPIEEIQKISSKTHFRPLSADNYSNFNLDDSQLTNCTRSDRKCHKEIQLKHRYSGFETKFIEQSDRTLGFNSRKETRQTTSNGQQTDRPKHQNVGKYPRQKTIDRKKSKELAKRSEREYNAPNEIFENSQDFDSQTYIQNYILKNMNEIAGYFKEIKEGDQRFEKHEQTDNLYDANEAGHSKPKKLFSFLKWFNKKQKQEPNLKLFKDSSAASSPMFPRKETSSCESIDTLFSTQTVRSFAYIPPTQYRPSAPPIDFDKSSYDNVTELVTPQKNKEESESIYDRRKKRKAPEPPRLSRENSLPTTLERKNDEDFDNVKTYHRRTVSESFKDKKAGAYCHVQGKRKAPPPPTPILYPNLQKLNNTNSTLHKKKKPAPPPPEVSSENTGQQARKDVTTDRPIDETKKEKSKDLKDVGNEEKEVKLNQTAKDRLTKDASLSPLPSRPWYKRSHRDSTGSNIIRKDLLKGFDKKKNKESDDWMPEVGFPRRSLSTESHSKFNIFSKLEKTEDKKKEEKRKSQISILTNISELDREAAEIVRKEQAEEKKMMAANDAKYYLSKENEKTNEHPRVPADGIHRDKSKPETQTKGQTPDGSQTQAVFKGVATRDEKLENEDEPKIKEEKLKDKENNLKPEAQTNDNPKPNSFSPNVLADLTNSTSLSPLPKISKPNQNPSEARLNYFNVQNKELSYLNEPWVCQKCTLENPGWRVFCEMCSSVKPRFTFNKTPQSTHPEKEEKKTEPSSSRTDKQEETKAGTKKGDEVEPAPAETLDELRKRRMTFFNSKLETLPESDKNDPGSGGDSSNTKLTKAVKEMRDPLKNSEENRKEEKGQKGKQLEQEKNEEKKENEYEMKEKKNENDIQRKEKAEPEKTKVNPEISNIQRKEKAEQPELTKVKPETSNVQRKEKAEQPEKPKVNPETSVSSLQNDTNGSQVIQAQPTQPEKVAEAYIITKTIVLEDIIVKKPDKARKVSASVQTKSSMPTSHETQPIKPPPRSKKIMFETNSEAAKAAEPDSPPNNGLRRNYRQEDLEELTTRLTQAEGLADFRANIETMPLNTEMNTVAVNRLLRKLETAINCGDQFVAAGLAKELAQMKINCSVTRQVTPSPGTSKITVDLYIEDKISHQGPIPLEVSPTMTLLQLKKKVQQELGISLEVQRWILGKKLATDDENTLEAEGVKSDYCPLFLYLVAPDNRKTDKDLSKTEKNSEEKPAQEPQPSPEGNPFAPKAKGWYYNYEEDHYSYCEDSDDEISGDEDLNKTKETAPKDENIPKISENNFKKTETEGNKKAEQPPVFDLKSRDAENDTEKELKFISVNSVKQKVEKLNRTFAENAKAIKPPLRSSRSPETWICGACNIVNSPGKLSCLSCKAKKVIVGPNNRKINEGKEFAKNQNPQKLPIQEKPKPADDNIHYKALIELQEADLVPNSEPFNCSICMVDYAIGEGVTLKDCLHTFCRNCLVGTVQFSEDAEVKCPYLDDTYSCSSVLQQREIKALVPKGIFELHLAKSVKEAENKIDNAFHCKTPDCKGWCIYEDNVNEFRCPVCRFTNCLTCQAIHTGINCREYQERMNDASETDVDAKKTREMLNEMVEKGEAMACPKCQVVLMKKWGCDWLRCSMCKTEICWVTRGFRWGPDGKGDTSGGCKCGVNGVKCHPKCNYCH